MVYNVKSNGDQWLSYVINFLQFICVVIGCILTNLKSVIAKTINTSIDEYWWSFVIVSLCELLIIFKTADRLKCVASYVNGSASLSYDPQCIKCTKKAQRYQKNLKYFSTREKNVFFLVKESVTYYVKANQYRICRRFFIWVLKTSL